jgi:hypothetical protein
MRSTSGTNLNESEHEINQFRFPPGNPWALLPHIDFIKQVLAAILETAQFPATLTDAWLRKSSLTAGGSRKRRHAQDDRQRFIVLRRVQVERPFPWRSTMLRKADANSLSTVIRVRY